MAAKRLNKKVALIGSIFIVGLLFVIVAAVLYLSQDPQKFIDDGDTAVKEWQAASDEELKEDAYKLADRYYKKAYSLFKDDENKIKMLYKLANFYLQADEWRYIQGCWSQIIQIDTQNAKARFGRLKFVYILADSGATVYWKEVESQAGEFLEQASDEQLADDPDKLESFEIQQRASGKTLKTHLQLIRGRALVEIASAGASTDPEKVLEEVIDNLEKVRQAEPGNVEVYMYLSRASLAKADIVALQGRVTEKEQYLEQARLFIEKAIEMSPDDPKCHLRYLKMKPVFSSIVTRDELETFEGEYLKLTKRFGDSGEIYSALSQYYSMLEHKDFDKAIDAALKSMELAPEKVVFAIDAANLYYRKFSFYGDREDLFRAIDIASNAFELPNAQETKGPRSWINRNNRYMLLSFLSNCFVEQAVKPAEGITPEQIDGWIIKLEDYVYQIEQLFGSGEAPQVVRWQGMLELAKGNENEAVRKLYNTYEQFKAAGKRDKLLAYYLSNLFKDSVELGAVQEFIAHALDLSDLPQRSDSIDNFKPQVLLDFAEVELKLELYNIAWNFANFFETRYWSDQRSQKLRILSHIGLKQFEQARQEIEKLAPDSSERLNFELQLNLARAAGLGQSISYQQLQSARPVQALMAEESPETINIEMATQTLDD